MGLSSFKKNIILLLLTIVLLGCNDEKDVNTEDKPNETQGTSQEPGETPGKSSTKKAPTRIDITKLVKNVFLCKN